MKTLNQEEMQQVAGGANWSKFSEYWRNGFHELGNALSEAGRNIRSDWRSIFNSDN